MLRRVFFGKTALGFKRAPSLGSIAARPSAAPGQLQRFRQGTQLAHHPGQLRPIANIEQQVNGGGGAVPFRGVDGLDIGVGGGNGGGDGGQYPRLLATSSRSSALKSALDCCSHSTSIHFSGFFVAGDVFAIVPVDDDATPGVEITDDGIARQRPTALAETDHRALGTLDQQGLGVDVLRRTHVVLAIFRQQSLGDQRRKRLPRPISASRPLKSPQVELRSSVWTRSAGSSQPADASDQRFFQQPFAEQDRFLAPQVFEVMTDAGAGLAVTTKLSQAGLGRAVGVMITSTVWPVVNGVRSGTSRRSTLAPTQVLPTSEWDGVGEVHGGGAARQIDDLAARVNT